ncbi:MAG: alpha-glucosidase [Nakamurella sp.]
MTAGLDLDRSTATAAPEQPWWRSAVVYQVYPRSFADSDGDGIGDLRGVVAKLDHLQHLGIDVIWLSPFFPSPQVDNGYDVSDYTAVDPLFGSLADFDELLTQAHARGIRVVIDVVPNHTSDQHAWFADSRSSRTAARRDWYVWRPPRDGMVGGEPGAEPNNWASFFSGSAWLWDEASGEYYLHLFAAEQPDLNWENPAVRTAMADVLRWWIDRGVDGFRFDVLNLISKVPGLPDGAPIPGTPWGDGTPCYTSGPRVHEFVAELTAVIRRSTPEVLMTVGEMPGVSVTDGVLFTDPDRREVDMVFQFDHVDLDRGVTKFDVRPFDLVALKQVFARWQDGLGDRGWNSQYWSNHDQPRAVSRFGDDAEYRREAATLLGTVLHLHRGTPFVYQGEELGMTNTPLRGPDDLVDIESVNAFEEAAAGGHDVEPVMRGIRSAGRENARTPMQWDAGNQAGFTTGTPWLAVNPNFAEINAEAQVGDPDSVLEYYRRLIALRHNEPTVVLGDYTQLLPEHPQLYAYLRATEVEELLVLANFGSDELVLPDTFTDWAETDVLIANHPVPVPLAPLGAWQARVLRRAR